MIKSSLLSLSVKKKKKIDEFFFFEYPRDFIRSLLLNVKSFVKQILTLEKFNFNLKRQTILTRIEVKFI